MGRKDHKRAGGKVDGTEALANYRKHLPGPTTITRYVDGKPVDSYTIPAQNLNRTRFLG